MTSEDTVILDIPGMGEIRVAGHLVDTEAKRAALYNSLANNAKEFRHRESSGPCLRVSDEKHPAEPRKVL